MSYRIYYAEKNSDYFLLIPKVVKSKIVPKWICDICKLKSHNHLNFKLIIKTEIDTKINVCSLCLNSLAFEEIFKKDAERIVHSVCTYSIEHENEN
jgi:hypothetical protein